MATRRSSKDSASGRFRLDGGDEIEERPALAVHAVDAGGQVLATAKVGDDGSFRLDDAVLAKSRRVVLTAADGNPAAKESALSFRASTFQDLVRAGDIAIGERDWARFLYVTHCIDATIRRCFPFFHTLQDLVSVAKIQLRPVGPVLQLPTRFRCSPICVGRVTVYRRRCCCPPIFIDPPELIEIPEFDPPIVFDPPIPDPPPDLGPFPVPGPGPDPAPFALQSRVLTGGAVDVVKLNAAADHFALKTLAGEALQRYLSPRPYLWCHCGPPTKVAEGFVGEDGRIHVCWREPLQLIPRFCHDEYSFVVTQNIGGNTVTIYDGPAAGQWFDDDDDDIRLVSYHPQAIGCRDEDFPVDPGLPFVVLQDLGSTESHHLATPFPDSADSTFSGGPFSGLLEIGGISYALGGSVALRYHFSESMQGIGARYFRVQWAPADSAGDPDGPWETLPVPAWKTWRVDSGDIFPGSHALGPHTAGGESDLFHIPYETGVPLLADEEWQDGQFHAFVPTDSKVQGRYLVRIEVFNTAGTRLEPAAAGFSYRRWNTPTTTLPVPFGAMTHLIRTDNRPVVAQIPDITGPGASAGNCKFFVGHGGENVVINYRAFHPQAGTPSFMLDYDLRITRGISGTLATPVLSSTVEAGEGGPPATHSVTISDLLDGEDKCSFAATLRVHAKIHNGSTRLSNLDASHISAFAVELA